MKAWICGAGILVGATVGWCAEFTYLSPEHVALAPDGRTALVTAATGGRLLVYCLQESKVAAEWPLLETRRAARRGIRSWFVRSEIVGEQAFNPTGVAIAADGTIYVTAGVVNGVLIKLAPDGRELGRVETGHSPLSPVVTANGATVFVLNRFDNTVAAVDTATMAVRGRVNVLREPHAAALGVEGRLLFVANHLPYNRATEDIVASSVSVIDTATLEVRRHVMLPNGSTNVRGMGATPDGRSIYVTHTFGRYQLPTTQLERGWMNTAGLSVFDGASGEFVNTALLDDVDLGAANPWGVAVTADGKNLIVAHAGTREISVIDRQAFHARLEQAARNERVTEVTRSAADVPNDLSFLVSLRRRIRLEADGPRGVIVAGSRALVACYFADALAEVNLEEAHARPVLRLLGPEVDLSRDRVRRGEMLWNDGTMCFQQWQSCASCHPDGRTDGLNWDLLNDGIGNPKQTKNMLYSHLTPPSMVTGVRENMEAGNRMGMRHIQFVVRPEEDAISIDQFVMSLRPVPSPYLVNGQLSRAAQLGAAVFQRAGCAECHPPARTGPEGLRLFTDLKAHDVGLGVGNEEGREFDTTTLVEVWRSAPYLYDGRSLTMEEVLTLHNPNDTHGKTQNLSQEEIRALAEYMLSF